MTGNPRAAGAALCLPSGEGIDAGWSGPPGEWTEGPKPIEKERLADGPHE